MPNETIRIGNVEILSLSDTEGNFPVANFFPAVPAASWRRYRRHLGADGNLHPNIGCFAVRSSGRTIMVDTGYGPGVSGKLFEDMRAKGVRPEEVTRVAFTHLHPDHVGWNMITEGGRARPAFPNARYLIPTADFDFFTSPEGLNNFPYIKDQVVPLVGLGLIDFLQPETDITPELRVWSTPGHTPGHISILINSAGEKGVILGDVAHSPVQAHETDWNCGFDLNQDRARATRHAVLDRIEQEGLTVAAGHFPYPSFGKLVRVRGRRTWRAL
jgi:glyoxylase-like metal-dependent hydrolase (beta-lactamase superfamily II)